MSHAHAHAAPSAKFAAGAAFKAKLQRLRRTNNLTNWYYLARTYIYLIVVIGAAVALDLARQSQGLPWWASLPAFAVAVVLVGAGQHQLSGLGHEGSHHILFRSRRLNELASDILCLYPLFSSTYHYRLQHLAHHQFVNDPERDPDLAQLEASGHRLAFPLPRGEARRALLRQLRPARLLAYLRARAVYGAAGAGRSPYALPGRRSSTVAVKVGAAGMLAQLVAVVAAVALKSAPALAALPPLLFALTALAFALLPQSMYLSNRLRPVIGLRSLAVLRVGHLAAVLNLLGWVQLGTGAPALAYYASLWLVPMLTSYPALMVLRQTVQHGNGDRGWLTNTRVFFVHRAVRFAVFPAGQDFHLPHHLFATVPHYRLRQLHEELLTDPEYAEHATEVFGYFAPPRAGGPQARPTALDILGPDYAPRVARPAHVDHTVLDDCVVEGREEIGRGVA